MLRCYYHTGARTDELISCEVGDVLPILMLGLDSIIGAILRLAGFQPSSWLKILPGAILPRPQEAYNDIRQIR